MARSKIREVETHHNQNLTEGASSHLPKEPSSPVSESKQKVVVLRLNESEYQSFKARGGAKAFKSWLADS